MARLLLPILVVIGLFLLLPALPAAVWSLIPLALLGAALVDVYRRGRWIQARRKAKGETDDATRLATQLTLLYVLWIGLTVTPSEAQQLGGGEMGEGFIADFGGDPGGAGFGGGDFGGGGGDGGGGGF